MKFEQLGFHATKIVHDVRNLNTVIRGNVELAVFELNAGNSSSVADCLRQAIDAVDRASDLVADILSFTGQQHCVFNEVHPGLFLNEVVTLIRPSLPPSVKLQVAVTDDLPIIEADTKQLSRVLLNLATNAKDAMDRGGDLTVGVRAASAADAPEDLPPVLRQGAWVCFYVADTGMGMADEVLNRIFEPFFTTKAGGRGTGLGLVTVRDTVAQHRGVIEVHSKPGHGTTFEIYLPTLGA